MEIAIVGTGKVAENNYIPSLLRHEDVSVSYTHLTLPTRSCQCRSRWGADD